MKAAQINGYGDSSVIEINEVDKPTVTEGQILVEVHAASLNPFDTAIRAGYMKDAIPLQFPATLGGDIAGVVEEIGDGVTNVSVGDKVYGQANVVAGNSGAFAEYAATKAEEVAKAPAELDFEQNASLPLVGVSAMQALNQHLELKSGQKIFIHGGAGAIGLVALQLAKHLGAYVATTATGEGIGRVSELSADQVIDYKTEDFVDALHDFDAVFDTVGGDDFMKSLSVLKASGTAVTMIAEVDKAKAKELNVTAIRQQTHVTTEALDQLTKLVDDGVITSSVGKVFPLDEIKAAFDARESGTVQGKVVLQVN